jgi:hypothetical protein
MQAALENHWVGEVEGAGMRLTVNEEGRAVSFDSRYTDDEALGVLRGLVALGRVISSFADDLLRQAEGGRKLSRGQLNWVHKLVADAERRAQTRTVGEVTGQTRKSDSHRWSHPGS